MQHHFRSLVLGHVVSLVSLVLLRGDNLALFVQPGQLMVHAADNEVLLLEEITALDQVVLRLADYAGDLLTSALRLLLKCDFTVNLSVDLLFKFDIE